MNALDKLKEIKKLINSNEIFNYTAMVNYYCIGIKEELDYANKYHNLEEQLGCPLEVVFKALDKGFYIDTKKVEKEPSWENPMERISFVGCPKYFRLNLWYKTIEVDRFGHYLEIWLKDYKKTWWLKEDKSE